ncbi:MAG: hypothetical protein BAJATHORv1_10217 [Candidatus Thorarchaeota archaeon]|nr:MAG: hypothetical protein BAJATHORv1_10217 [Candidatus Thorarchaeota archaeon]
MVKKMATKTKLPKSAIIVLDHLSHKGPQSPQDISSRTNMPLRTVTFALKKLLGAKFCKRIPNLQDMRRPLYAINRSRHQDVRETLASVRARETLRLKRV